MQSERPANRLSKTKYISAAVRNRCGRAASRRIFFSLALVILSLVMIQPIMGTSTKQTGTGVPWLHVQGNRIVDENGSPVILRGVNIAEQYDMSYAGLHTFNEADAAELAQKWQINVIRVPIFPELWQYYPPYLQNILDPIVDLGNKYGIYIMLDWHAMGNPVTGQASIPSWANEPPFHGDPENVSISLATSFWNTVAEHYKNEPSVIYDIFNEPCYITWTAWRPVAEQLVDVVRSHNPNALILVPGVSWAYDLSGVLQDPVQRQNIVYDTHPYPLSSHWFGSWDNNFGYLAKYYPVFASEWGFQFGDSDPNLNATVQSYGQPLLTYMAQKIMSWTAFCWSTVWDPLMLQTYYLPTEFGVLVEQALDHSTTSTSTTTVITSSSTSSTTTSVSSSTMTTLSSTTSSTVSSTTTSVSSSTATTTLSSTTNSTVSSTTSSVSSSTSKVSAQMFTVVDSGQGSVTPNCPNGCSETVGSQVTVTANPGSGWLFSGWSTQSGQSCSSNPCTFNMPNNQVTLKATFTQIMQTLTTNVASGSGSVSPNCPGPNGCSTAVNSSISVQATPASGWQFSSWSITGASCSGGSTSNPCTFTMPNNPAKVSATFTQVTQTLITGVDVGSGSVGSNCPSGCSEAVGSSITVQANPSSGWQFSNWSTQSGISCSSNPCTFNMPNQQVTLKATFTQNPPSTQTLTTSVASGQGTVNPNCPAPSGCQETVSQTITVTGTASSGWQFSSWSVTGASCSGGSSSNPCQFTMPNSGVSVSATFTQTPPNAQSLFTGVDSGQGTISPNCLSGCSEAVGSSVTVTATPSSGWQYSNWSTQTGISCSTNPCTFTMPNNAVTLAATLTQVTQTLTTNVASGSGSVSPNCPGPNGCSTAVNSSISVQATPASGWQFSSWNVTGASCSGGASSNPCTFSMPNNPATVSATFTDPQTLITSVDAGSGSVLPNCPSGCSEAVDSSTTVTATPSSGWQFSSWSTQIGISCSSNPCTFSMPNNAVTLRAMFTQLFDFRLANSGTSSNLGGIAVQHGSSGTVSISVILVSGASQTVSLSCTQANGDQLPTGVSCSFNPASNSPDFSSTLTVSTNSSTPIGYYTIRVIGTGGGLARVTIFTLRVT